MMNWVLSVLCCLLAGSLGAAPLRLLSGESIEGKVDLTPRGITIAKAGGSPAYVDLATVLEISFRRTAAPAGDLLPPGVLLTNGTAIADRAPGLEDSGGTFGVEKIPVPVAAIAWVLFNPLAPAKLEAAPAGQTGGLLGGGDFFPGAVVSLKPTRVSLNSTLFGPQTFTPKTQLDAICLHPLKAAPARFVITTIAGSRFLTDALGFDAAGLVFKDSVLGELHIKSADLEALRAGPGRYLALAEQKPTKVETRPGADALQVQKGGADTAAVITSGATLAVTYDVPAGFTTFVAGVAVPKNAVPGYRIAFAVYGDGRPLFKSQLISVTDKIPPLRVDLRGARTLTLRVEPFGAVAGGGEWIAPALLR